MFFIGSFKIPQFINLKKLMEKKKKINHYILWV